MSRRPTALLLVLALLAGGCGILGDGGAYTVNAELSRSFNLFPGSPVRVLGVDVGQITDLVVPPGSDHVQVIMRIDGDVDVPADSDAIVVPESLLGERYVQLSPFTEGPRLEDGGTIPLERSQVPFEFDEVLESLNRFVEGLDEDEVARFVANFAETIDGQGEQLGRTIDQATDAIGVLKDNDEELIALVSRLADLNQTLNQRDTELGALIRDFDTLTASLVGDRDHIDAALVGLVRLTQQLHGLLQANRLHLEDDIAVLTRVGRTAQRNLDNLSLAIQGSAELFRHAERIIDREHNWIPLQAQLFPLVPVLTESILFRIEGLCLAAGLDADACAVDVLEGILGGVICAPPFIPCPPGFDAVPIEEALLQLVTADADLGQVLIDELERNAARRNSPDPQPVPEDDADAGDGGLRDALDGFGRLLGGLR